MVSWELIALKPFALAIATAMVHATREHAHAMRVGSDSHAPSSWTHLLVSVFQHAAMAAAVSRECASAL